MSNIPIILLIEKRCINHVLISKSVRKEKYKTIQLEMELGDILFFDGQLAQRSGHNTINDERRFSLFGMWHDINFKSIRVPRYSRYSRQ